MEVNLRKLGFLFFSINLYLACSLLHGIPSSIKLLDQGMAAFEVGLYDIAAKSFSEIIYNYPSDPVVVTASFLEALSLYYAEDLEAVDHFKDHSQRYSDSPYRDQLWYWIGMGELLNGNKEAGLNSLDRYLLESTVDSSYYLYANDAKARVLEQLHRYKEALLLYNELLTTKNFNVESLASDLIVHWLDRSGALSLKIGLFEDAEQYYRRLLVNHSSSDKVKDALFWIGESAYWGGKILEAAERFQRYIETFPNGLYQKTAIFRLSRISLETDKLDKANYYLNMLKTKLDSLQDTNEIVGFESDRIAILVLQADIYIKEDKWIDAVNVYRDGFGMTNDKRTQQLLQNKVGVALKQTGDITAAINIFQKAETGPDINLGEIAMYNKIVLLVETGKLELAVQTLISFNDQFPDSVHKVEVEKLLLDLTTEINDFTGQIDILNSISKTRPLTFSEKKLQGIALINMKDYSKAIKVFSNTISSNDFSHLAEQAYYLGAAYAHQEEFIRAVPLFLSAMEYSDQSEEIHQRANYALATVYLNVGQYEESLFFLEKVIGLSEESTYSWLESALFARGSVFYRLRRLKEATNDFEKLAESKKDFFIGQKNRSFASSYQVAMIWQALSLFRSGDIDRTIPIFLNLANSGLPDKGYYWYRAGLSTFLLKDLIASEKYFLEALQYSDNSLLKPQILYELFKVYLDTDDVSAVNSTLKVLREEYPNNYLTGLAGINKAEKFKRLGFLPEASSEFQLISKLLEENATDHSEFGDIALYEAIKIESKSLNRHKVLDLAWRFLNIYPNSSRLDEIGTLFNEGLNNVSYAVVQEYFELVTDGKKNNLVPYELEKIIYLSYAERNLKFNPEAIGEILEELLVKTTSNIHKFDILSMIGRSYEEAEMFDAALNLYQGMVLSTYDVQAASGALGLSRVLLKLGDITEAAKQYGITAIRFQNIPHVAAEAWYRGSQIYLLSENFKEAEIFQEQLLSLFPDSEWAKIKKD